MATRGFLAGGATPETGGGTGGDTGGGGGTGTSAGGIAGGGTGCREVGGLDSFGPATRMPQLAQVPKVCLRTSPKHVACTAHQRLLKPLETIYAMK